VISVVLMTSSSVEEPLSAESVMAVRNEESVKLAVSTGLSVEDRLFGDGLSDGGDDGDVFDEDEDPDVSGS
jgi:hypothetical protein